MRSWGFAITLAAIWVLLWGSASPANVISGVLIGVGLVWLVPGLGRRRGGERAPIRPLAIAHLVGYMLLVTVRSNVELIREVLSRQSRIRTAIVGVPLPGCSDELLTLVSNLLALSPGTMPIELRQDPIVLYVHVLHLTDIEDFRRETLHLADLTVRAFGTARAVADQDAFMRARGLR